MCRRSTTVLALRRQSCGTSSPRMCKTSWHSQSARPGTARNWRAIADCGWRGSRRSRPMFWPISTALIFPPMSSPPATAFRRATSASCSRPKARRSRTSCWNSVSCARIACSPIRASPAAASAPSPSRSASATCLTSTAPSAAASAKHLQTSVRRRGNKGRCPMAATASDFSAFRFSTEDLPERDRIAAWRKLYGRKFLRLEHEPQPDLPFHADVSLQLLPGLGIVSATATLLRVQRNRQLIADGNDNLTLQISTTAGLASQLGREAEVGAGDAVVLSNADVGTFTFQSTQSASKVLALSLPRSSMGSFLRDPDAALVRAVPKEMEALRLLKRYVGIVEDAPALATPELRQLVVTHVYDLLALALGATHDAKEIAEGRGLRAARLAAVKAKVMAKLDHRDLSADTVGKSQGFTAGY